MGGAGAFGAPGAMPEVGVVWGDGGVVGPPPPPLVGPGVGVGVVGADVGAGVGAGVGIGVGAGVGAGVGIGVGCEPGGGGQLAGTPVVWPTSVEPPVARATTAPLPPEPLGALRWAGPVTPVVAKVVLVQSQLAFPTKIARKKNSAWRVAELLNSISTSIAQRHCNWWLQHCVAQRLPRSA